MPAEYEKQTNTLKEFQINNKDSLHDCILGKVKTNILMINLIRV